MPTMTPAITTTMTPLRICLRRFCCLASAARRASRAARWRALFSLGTAARPYPIPGARHPDRSGRAAQAAVGRARPGAVRGRAVRSL